MSDSPAAILYDSAGNELKGQKTAAASVPVVVASDQAAVPVSASSLPLPTGAATSAKQPAIGTAGTPSADVISVQGVSGGTPQPVSAASLPLPSGAATESTLSAMSGKLPATLGQKAMAASMAVVVASDQGAVPISAAALPLPSGAATSALQTTGNTSVGNIDTKTPALGQAAMAASTPVVIANNQTAVPVSGPLTDTQLRATAVPVSAASLPLPTGAATEATLSAINTKLPATVGQKTMAASLPMTLASDQTPLANPAATTGTITALNGTVSAAVQGYNSCMLVLTGTWSASLVFEISADGGTSWFQGAFAAPPAVVSPLPVPMLLVTTNGTFQGVGMGAITNVRVRASAFTSGTVNARLVFGVGAAGLLPGFTAIQQNVTVSINNNSVANLAAAASFNGTSESTLGVNAIQINFKADQPCQLALYQSSDGTNWDQPDILFVPANYGEGRTFQAVGSFFKVSATNLGGATTTFLRLQSVLCPVAAVEPRALSSYGGVKVDGGVGTGSWLPATPATFFGLARGTRAPLSLGADGSLQCYSEVLTDAGSFRDDFIAALQSNLTGTWNFVNNAALVSGSGGAATTEIDRFTFIRATAHADSVLASVLNVLDDNTVILAAPYTGATANGVVGVKTSWFPTVGTGGSVSVANSLLAIAAGTTNGANTWVQRGSDYGPLEATLRFSLSQRIANQTCRLGLFDSFTNPKYMACVELTGTTNTQVTLTTRSNTGANDVESVTVTLPGGATTASQVNLKIDLHPDRVTLYYDPADGSSLTFLAMCKNHIPPLYVSLLSGYGFLNTGTPGSGTTLSVDMVYLKNYNLLDTKAEASGAPDADTPTVTSVAAAVADTLLLAANKSRKAATVYNDSLATLYLKMGSGASLTSFTVRVPSNGYYEVQSHGAYVYNGALYGYWTVATGNARVTEVA
jgi:hypothetical protein